MVLYGAMLELVLSCFPTRYMGSVQISQTLSRGGKPNPSLKLPQRNSGELGICHAWGTSFYIPRDPQLKLGRHPGISRAALSWENPKRLVGRKCYGCSKGYQTGRFLSYFGFEHQGYHNIQHGMTESNSFAPYY